MELLTDEVRHKIIVNGDENELITQASNLGEALVKEFALKTNQIRGIFGTVRRIEMDWRNPNESNVTSQRVKDAQRELALLQPRMQYQAAREKQRRNFGVEALSKQLIPMIKLVTEAKSLTPYEHYSYFRNFVDFFEAVLAYHRASGGKD